MRSILLFLSCCLIVASCASNNRAPIVHEGLYSTPPDLSASSFTLYKDHRFEYAYANCTGGMKGQGHYDLEKDTIRFRFEVAPTLSNQIDVKKIETKADSIYVDMHVAVRSFEPSPAVGCSVAMFDGENLIGGRIGDVNGNVSLQATGTKPLRIKVAYSGCRPEWINLDSVGRYNIRLELEDSFATDMLPQTLTYRLVRLSHNALILGAFDSPELWRLYRRKRTTSK